MEEHKKRFFKYIDSLPINDNWAVMLKKNYNKIEKEINEEEQADTDIALIKADQ